MARSVPPPPAGLASPARGAPPGAQLTRRWSWGTVLATGRFFLDPRVGWGPKLLALLAVAYLIFPLDLIPDALPLIGWLDDAGVLALAATYLLTSLSRYQREAQRR